MPENGEVGGHQGFSPLSPPMLKEPQAVRREGGAKYKTEKS